MRYGAFVEQVDHLGTRLADNAEQDLEVAVPTCPGWSASDLVRHVAQVYRAQDRLDGVAARSRPVASRSARRSRSRRVVP